MPETVNSALTSTNALMTATIAMIMRLVLTRKAPLSALATQVSPEMELRVVTLTSVLSVTTVTRTHHALTHSAVSNAAVMQDILATAQTVLISMSAQKALITVIQAYHLV